MKDKYFIDTNILVYAHDSGNHDKQKKSKKMILEGLREDKLVLSTQVLCEFFVTITKKISVPLDISTARKEIELLQCAEIVEISHAMILDAIDLRTKRKLSFWDSLIVVSAQAAGCGCLYTEDLQHGLKLKNLEVINPYQF